MPFASRFRPVLVVLFALLLAPVAAGQTISYVSLGSEVGAGLQIGSARARLSSSTHGGITVHLESTDPAIGLVSPTASIAGTGSIDVFVTNGSTDAFFYVQGLEDTTGTFDIIASAPGFAPETTSVSVVQPAVEIVSLPTTRDAFGTDANFYVRVGLPSGPGISPTQQVRAGSLGLVATLTNSVAGVAQLVTLPDTAQTVAVTIDPGTSQSASTPVGGGVAFDPLGVGMTTVTVSIPGLISTPNASRDVTVTQPVISVFNLGVIGAGLIENGVNGTLSGTQHGGVTVHVESADSSLVLVSASLNDPGTGSVDIFVANGGSGNFTFYAHGLEDTVGTTTIHVTAPGFTAGQIAAEVVVPGVTTYGIDTSVDVLDPIRDVRARVGIPNGSLTSINPAQSRRPGAPPLSVTMATSDSTVLALVSLSDTASVLTTEIPPGTSVSPTYAAGGVGEDGLTAGTSTVTLSIPGFLSLPASGDVVTVSQPAIVLGAIGDVGSGLRSGTEYVNLSAAAHGGVTVTLTSRDPDLVLLSQTAGATVGQASIDIFFANNDTSEPFYVHGLEDTTGLSMVVATEPNYFQPDSAGAEVVPPGISILSLASTFDTLDPTEDFVLRVGIPHSSGGYVGSPQDLRPGGGGLLATVSSSDPSVAEIVTLADTSGTLPFLIAEGRDTTPSTVASGGVGADGLSPGTSVISVTAPGFLPMTNASQLVTVTAPTMALSVTDVGAGLQSSLRQGFLSASNHPGVFVTVESLDSTRVLIAPSESSPGSGSIDVYVAPGNTAFPYVIQALEDTTGTVSLRASATYFLPDTATVEVVQPGVRIVGLGTSLDAADTPDAFYAIVGRPSVDNSTIPSTYYQDVRVGGPGLDITFTTSDSTASTLDGPGQSGGTVVLSIPPGSDRTSTTGGGAVALDALAEGSTVVSAAAPGFISTGTAFVTVFLTNDNLYLLGLPVDIGSGLQTGALTAKFGTGSHGGVTLRIESADSTLVRVSTVSGAAGDPFVEVFVPNNTTEATYFLHGQAGMLGETLITATAAGFPDAVDTARVVTPVVGILSLADSLDVADPNDEFLVQIGVPDESGTMIATPQRAGSGQPLNLTVITDDPAVGLLATTATTNDTIQLVIAAGESQTQGTVAAGGLAFVPAGPGYVTVTPLIGGFTSLARTVLVTGPPVAAEGALPFPLTLAQNVPNPFRPQTAIRFTLPASGPVSLTVYDVRGREVRTLVDEIMPAGTFEARWDGTSDHGVRMGAGVYYYRMVAGGQALTRSMVLLR